MPFACFYLTVWNRFICRLGRAKCTIHQGGLQNGGNTRFWLFRLRGQLLTLIMVQKPTQSLKLWVNTFRHAKAKSSILTYHKFASTNASRFVTRLVFKHIQNDSLKWKSAVCCYLYQDLDVLENKTRNSTLGEIFKVIEWRRNNFPQIHEYQ